MSVTIGYIVGSLSKDSVNRRLARALTRVAPDEVEMVEIPIGDLPLYNHDHDLAFPDAAVALKKTIEAVDGIVVVSPEYNRSIPGALKNAIDYASRPWGHNSWTGKPVAVIGTGLSPAGTAVAQAQLRSILGFCGTVVMGHPETCLQWREDLITDDGTAAPETAEVLRTFLTAATAHIATCTGRQHEVPATA